MMKKLVLSMGLVESSFLIIFIVVVIPFCYQVGKCSINNNNIIQQPANTVTREGNFCEKWAIHHNDEFYHDSTVFHWKLVPTTFPSVFFLKNKPLKWMHWFDDGAYNVSFLRVNCVCTGVPSYPNLMYY